MTTGLQLYRKTYVHFTLKTNQNSNPTIAHVTHWMRNLLMAKGQFTRAQNITKVPKGWNIDMKLMWRPRAIQNWKHPNMYTQSQCTICIDCLNQYKSDRMLCFISLFLNECNTLFPFVHGRWVCVNSDSSCPSNPLNRIEAIGYLFWFVQCT
jgi:hypothetical protein